MVVQLNKGNEFIPSKEDEVALLSDRVLVLENVEPKKLDRGKNKVG